MITIIGVFGLFGVAFLDLHGFHISVHVRDTVSPFQSDVNESFLAPRLAPRVLNDPVGLAAVLFGQTDDGYAVVDAPRTIVILRKNSVLVVAPAGVSSSHSDAQGSLL